MVLRVRYEYFIWAANSMTKKNRDCMLQTRVKVPVKIPNQGWGHGSGGRGPPKQA